MVMELEIKKYDRGSRKREHSSQRIEFSTSTTTSSINIGQIKSMVLDLKERALAKNTRVPISYLDLLFDLENFVEKQDFDKHSLYQLTIKARKEAASLQSISQQVDAMINEKNELVQTTIARFEADEIERFKSANDAKNFLLKLLETLFKSESELTAEYLEHAKQNGLPQRINKLRAFIKEVCVEDFRKHGYEYTKAESNGSSFTDSDALSNNWSARDYAKISAKLNTVLPIIFGGMVAAGASFAANYRLFSDWNQLYTEPLKEIAKSIRDDYEVEIEQKLMVASLQEFRGLASDAGNIASTLEEYVLSL